MPPHIITSLLLGAALVTGCGTVGSPDASGDGPASERLALTARPATTEGTEVLGPAGWRGLNLGMSEPRAITTGLLGRRRGSPTPCQQWSTKRPATVSSVFISQRLGVAAIASARGAPIQTPKGMTFGWTFDQVTRAYPGISPSVDGENARFIPVPGSPKARYRVGFDAAGRVSALTLELAAQDCYP